MVTWRQINFQNSISPLIEQFIFLHDHIISILLVVTLIVSYFIVSILINKNILIKQNENHELEILWTFLPGIILILIALPSIRLLYLSEESENNYLNIKTIGHQWYWSYEISSINTLDFDRFMQTSNNPQTFRLLDTDNCLSLPSKTPVQILISSADVLHSWTLPSLGVKSDSTPGRINVSIITFLKRGSFFGQCSEICGTNHRFIPIVVNSYPLGLFKNLIKTF